MKALLINDDGTTHYVAGDRLHIEGGTEGSQYDTPLDAVIDLGLVELNELHINEFRRGWQKADREGLKGQRVRTGLEAIGFKVRPDYDQDTANALTVAVWGTSVPNEAGEAGRLIARQLARHGKKIVDA